MADGKTTAIDKLTILCDMDDTIEYLLQAWIKYLNDKYCLEVKIEDCHDWDMQKLFTTLTREQIFSALADTELWKLVKPIEHAPEILRKLQDEGHDIVLVTASTYFNVHDKITYVIDRYFPFIEHKNIIVAHRKQLIMGDVLIDDYPRNLIGGSYKKILFTAQHNLGFDIEGTDIVRARNWLEIYDLCQNILSEKIARA